MDGLLVDTEVVYRDAMIGEAHARQRELPFSVFQRMIGLPANESDRVAMAHFGADFDLADYNLGVMRRVTVATDAGVCLKPGVLEMLDHLEATKLPRAIATSSSHQSVVAHIGHTGIIARFDAVIARGDYAKGKPNPDPFLAAAAALGVAPQACLALEDSHNGVRAAHAAGMMTVMVPDLLQATQEMHRLCVHVADSLHHVLAMLRNGGADVVEP